MSLPQQKCEYSDWQSKRPVLPVDSRVYGHIDLYLFCEYEQINANTGKPTCWFGEGLSNWNFVGINKGCGGWEAFSRARALGKRLLCSVCLLSWVDERNRFGGLAEFFSQLHDANFSVR